MSPRSCRSAVGRRSWRWRRPPIRPWPPLPPKTTISSLTVTLHLDPAAIKQMVGSGLGGHFVLAEVKVAPKYGKEVAVSRDDFLLLDTDHNDRSKPFAANQIVGPRCSFSAARTTTRRRRPGPGRASPGRS